MINVLATALKYFRMAGNTTVNTLKTNRMDKDSTPGPPARPTKENGGKGSSTGMAFGKAKKAKATSDSGQRANAKDSVCTHGRTVTSTKGNGKLI